MFRNLKAAKALGMQTIREGLFFFSLPSAFSISRVLSRRSPFFFLGVPIGGSLEAVESLESILGINLESPSAEDERPDAGVGTLVSMPKL